MPAPQSVIDFFTAILQDENLKEQFQGAIASLDTPTLLKLAKERGHDFTAKELSQGLKQIQNILPSRREIENLTIKEYRCTRNFPYPNDDPNDPDHLVLRQGHYIHAHSEEEAWQQMAARYPSETSTGFTVQDWSDRSGKSVTILRVEEDEVGNKVLVNKEGKKAITNDDGDVIGYEDSSE